MFINHHPHFRRLTPPPTPPQIHRLAEGAPLHRLLVHLALGEERLEIRGRLFGQFGEVGVVPKWPKKNGNLGNLRGAPGFFADSLRLIRPNAIEMGNLDGNQRQSFDHHSSF